MTFQGLGLRVQGLGGGLRVWGSKFGSRSFGGVASNLCGSPKML